MSNSDGATQAYLRNTVMTATPEQLQLMLYDGAIRFTLRGREAIEAGDREVQFESLDRAQRIVLELANGVNRDVNPELADQMLALYDFVYRRLVDANLEGSITAIDEAVRILRHQRETWVLLLNKLQQHAASGSERPPTAPTPVSAHAADATTEECSSFVAEG